MVQPLWHSCPSVLQSRFRIIPSTCDTRSHSYSAAHSPPTPLSHVFPLQEGHGAHCGTADRHLWRDHCTGMSIWTDVGTRMNSCCMQAAMGEGYTSSSWHCTNTADCNFNGNTVISKIFSPPVFVSYNLRTGSEAGEFHCLHILNG